MRLDCMSFCFFFSSRRRHTRCALVTGVQTCAVPISRVTRDWDVTLMFEPGRVIAGNSGVLLTEILWVKPGATHPFVIVDAAMNDLARPALYDAWHDFAAVKPSGETMTASIVGPVCETGEIGRAHV